MKDCLDRIDNMINDKSLKYMVIDDLELIRDHISCQQSEVVIIEERLNKLSLFGQIIETIESFYSNDSEEKLDEHYIKLGQRVFAWYEMNKSNFISKKSDLKKKFYK